LESGRSSLKGGSLFRPRIPEFGERSWEEGGGTVNEHCSQHTDNRLTTNRSPRVRLAGGRDQTRREPEKKVRPSSLKKIGGRRWDGKVAEEEPPLVRKMRWGGSEKTKKIRSLSNTNLPRKTKHSCRGKVKGKRSKGIGRRGGKIVEGGLGQGRKEKIGKRLSTFRRGSIACNQPRGGESSGGLGPT